MSETKEKDLSQTIYHLSGVFNNATSKLPRAVRHKTQGTNRAYQLQVEFAYLLNELTQGPRCMQQKYITDINNFIDAIITEFNTESISNTPVQQ